MHCFNDKGNIFVLRIDTVVCLVKNGNHRNWTNDVFSFYTCKWFLLRCRNDESPWQFHVWKPWSPDSGAHHWEGTGLWKMHFLQWINHWWQYWDVMGTSGGGSLGEGGHVPEGFILSWTPLLVYFYFLTSMKSVSSPLSRHSALPQHRTNRTGCGLKFPEKKMCIFNWTFRKAD